MKRNPRIIGQASLEFAISATVIAVLLSGAGWVLKAEWDRGRCAYLTFERTHSVLTDTEESPASGLIPMALRGPRGTGGLTRFPHVKQAPAAVSVSDNGPAISGIGQCGTAIEGLSLLKLESLP